MQATVLNAFKEFDAFSALSEDDLLVLADRASLEQVKKRQVLFKRGDDDPWIYCLMEGTLELTAPDGQSHRIDAGTAAAKQPVARLTPRMYTAAAVTPARVLRIDSSELGDWQSFLFDKNARGNDGGISIEEISGDHIFNGNGFGAGDDSTPPKRAEYSLPSLPTVALEASRVVDADDTGIDKIAALVANDPAMAAKIIKASNSPVYHGRDQIASPQRAIVRLGLKTTRQLIMAFAMRDLFSCDDKALQAQMEKLWQHSVEVAAYAFVLSRHLKLFDAGEAQLAGLLHDIGKVTVLSGAARGNEVNVDEAVNEAQRDGARVGAILLEDWNFPPAVMVAARDADEWWRDDVEDVELADLVLMAQGMSLIGKPDFAAVPPLSRLPAYRKLFGDGASSETLLELVREAEAEVTEVKALLHT